MKDKYEDTLDFNLFEGVLVPLEPIKDYDDAANKDPIEIRYSLNSKI